MQDRLCRDLIGKGIDPKVAELFRRVPRHEFVPHHLQSQAYDDRPLPIGSHQTISQPYIVALMTQTADLHSGMRVLEVGTGSGYQAAILAETGAEIYTIELLPELLQRSYNTLTGLGYKNIHFKLGDGTLGWEEEAPFDRIVVTAAPPDIPPSLVRQLADGGRMVIPVGGEQEQQLLLVARVKTGIETETVCPVVFVKLIGKEGYAPSSQ